LSFGGLTSLNENEDRLAIMMSFTLASNGELLDETVSRSWVRNRAQLAYSRVRPWLDAGGNDTKNVGDVVQVKLIHTDPARAFIDLARV
jgi:exoribonuclease R